MLVVDPRTGITSQPMKYSGTAQPVVTSAATTKAIRTVVGLKPRHVPMPAAIPPPMRSSGSRRSGLPSP